MDWGFLAMEIAVGGTDATGSPEVIARSFTEPQASPNVGVSLEPTTVSRSFAAPQAGIQSAVSLTPTTVSRSFAEPQTSPQAGSTVTPNTVATASEIPQLGAEGGLGAEAAQANETDEAQAIAYARAYGIGQATETDEAIRFSLMRPVGIAEETDIAQAVDNFKGQPGTGIVRSPNRARIYASHNEVT
jgi:hypothetical protein